jgi:hypothetical protein
MEPYAWRIVCRGEKNIDVNIAKFMVLFDK